MSDQRLSRMLRRAGAEPSQEFVAALRRDLLAGFGETAASTSSVPGQAQELYVDTPDMSEDGYVPVQKPPSAPHRRRWPILAAAAVLAIVATVAVISRRHAPDVLRPSTTPEHSFSQRVSVDVQTPGGATVHVDGTVALPQAVESNESSEQLVHDVLLLPRVAVTFTNTGVAPLTIAQVSVEIFLRGDRTGCIVNASGCDSAVIIAAPHDATTPAAVGPGEALTLTDAGRSSRISVLADEVPFAIDQVRDGSMVVGYAVVVRAGAAGDDTASVVFDRTGRAVLTCASAPEDCLGQTRAALGDDASYVPETTVPGVQLPSTDLPSGRHTTGSFRVPVAFVTTKSWNGVIEAPNNVVFRRTGADPTVVVQAVAFAVLRSTAERQTLSDVLSTTCPGSLDLTAPTDTTLYGTAALSVTSVLSEDCVIFPDMSRDKARRGDTMRITATNIDGNQFLVALAIASSGHWADFTDEVDAFFASIVPA